MSLKRRIRGFTLVELLVVIGIIALLISILLPSLNRARQMANLIYCQSNLRQVGQLVQLYAASNNGYLPPLNGFSVYTPNVYNGYWQEYRWHDLLTLLVTPAQLSANQAYFPYTTPLAANHPVHTLQAYHDVDVPPEARPDYSTKPGPYGSTPNNSFGNPFNGFMDGNACDYTACYRVFMGEAQGGQDPLVGSYPGGGKKYIIRQQSSIKRPTQVFEMWDGACFDDGVYNWGALPTAKDIDSWNIYNCGMCYPQAMTSGVGPQPGWWNNGIYGNKISLGTGDAADGFPGSTNPGVTTLTVLQRQNRDATNTMAPGYPFTSTFSHEYDWCMMRFRHMGNTTLNVLFVDGHCDSRQLGQVILSDICTNAPMNL